METQLLKRLALAAFVISSCSLQAMECTDSDGDSNTQKSPGIFESITATGSKFLNTATSIPGYAWNGTKTATSTVWNTVASIPGYFRRSKTENAPLYDLNNPDFRARFSQAHAHCGLGNSVALPWDDLQGKRYTSDQGTCASFVNTIQSFGAVPVRDIYEATNKVNHAYYLKMIDGHIDHLLKKGDEADEAKELQLRELLRAYEKDISEEGHQSLVQAETLDDAKRMEYLRYKVKIGNLEKEVQSNSKLVQRMTNFFNKK